MIDTRHPDFRTTPASDERPAYQFAPQGEVDPFVSIITPYYNAGPVFAETCVAIERMTFAQWEWLIVDDGTTDAASLAQLEHLRQREPRVRVLRQANGGPAVARNHAVREARGRYLLQLDADDLVEPTFLEKALWTLETQPQFAACNSYNVTFGVKNLLWPYGFQNYEESLDDNKLTTQAVIRRDAWLAAGGYDERISYEHADWDFWLNLAESGRWGYTIAEYLTWYRTQARSLLVEIEQDVARAERFRAWLRAKHAGLRARFPYPVWRRNETPILAPPAEEPPFVNPLAKPAGVRRALVLAPWFEMGGADTFNLELVRNLSRRGYQFTLVTTAPSDNPWLARFAALTPDIFCLDRFLDCADYPRFLSYLIQSRQIDAVIISNSELGYGLAPYLRATHPTLALLDYTHMEDDGWRDGGYPAMSVSVQAALDAQVTCTEHLRRWMGARGGELGQITTCYCGVDTEAWSPAHHDAATARARLGVAADLPLILFVGRVVEQKRPLLFARVLAALRAREPRFVALVVGDGPELGRLRRFVRRHGLQRHVRFLGALPGDEVRALLAAGDMLLLPSEREGLALALYESMAMECAPVAADVGGQAELVTPDCGYLIARGAGEHDPREIDAYVGALIALIQSPAERRAMAQRARQRVVERFDSARLAGEMDALITGAIARAATRPASAPAEALERARATMTAALEELRRGIALELAAVESRGNPVGAVARSLRKRYLPLGTRRYERYKRLRQGVGRVVHLTVSLPRYIRTGKLRAAPAYLLARMRA